MRKKLRVLLIGPRDPVEFEKKNAKWLMGGESTYITSLLENPPQGVEYVWYENNIKNQISNIKNEESSAGLFESRWAGVWKWLHKLRILPLSPGVRDLVLSDGSEFDVVHCHAYSLRLKVLSGKRPAVVLSDSSSNAWTLKEYFGWPQWRIDMGYRLKRWMCYRIELMDADLMTGRFDKLVVWSEWARRLRKERVLDKRVVVVAPGVKRVSKFPSSAPSTMLRATADRQSVKVSKKHGEITILFVGTWFERKGGRLLVEAVQHWVSKFQSFKVSKKVRLVMVGQIPHDLKYQISNIKYQMLEIEQYDYVSRNDLLNKFYPRADIFVLPVLHAEGFGVVVLEAMSFGMPMVVSDVCALPEIAGVNKFQSFKVSKFQRKSTIKHFSKPRNLETSKPFLVAEAGLVVKAKSAVSLEAALERLVKDDILRERLGRQARQRFKRLFSTRITGEKLEKVYRDAIQGRQ